MRNTYRLSKRVTVAPPSSNTENYFMSKGHWQKNKTHTCLSSNGSGKALANKSASLILIQKTRKITGLTACSQHAIFSIFRFDN
jgi:uncharacterized iron-regulated membrane protein